jgi:predicted AlkP superfamily pyrophosphatase or phosphodiesterase
MKQFGTEYPEFEFSFRDGLNSSLVISFILFFCMLTMAPVYADQSGRDIRLVLQITVDGLRADLVSRGAGNFGDGGFRYLLDNGAVFANAHYQHANTETIVGHATLATGAHPSVHGMTGNVWYDAEAGELAYNIEDPDSPILPVREQQQSGDQVDPSQLLARTQGRSPATLLAETFADKLLAYSAGRSKIFAVSGKDRSAVALAGRGGKAFWMSTDSGDFVTSGWYYAAYPAWAAEWNAQRKAKTHASTQWTLLNDRDSYILAGQDDRPYETDLRGFGRTFPHRFGDGDNKLLYTQLIASPIGDALLADFAQTLFLSEKLGQGPAVDFLSVSFSGVDAVNHFFGPASLENEDMVLQLDRTLARFLAFIDQQVGLEHTVIVLSADHGIAELPEYMAERGLDTGRLTPDVILEAVERISQEKFGFSDITKFYYRPYLYLDQDRIQAAGLNPEVVRETLAGALTLEPGIHLAATRQMLESWPDRKLFNQIRNNYHPVRSGDIYIVQEPYWFNFDKGPVTGMHGSPWNYDTHVPVVFAGPGIPATRVQRRVQPADVAPTLAAILGMSPPASAQGNVLREVFTTGPHSKH